MTSPTFNIVVVGAGGIGGICTAKLLAAGHRVTAISTNPDIRQAVAHNGFVVSGHANLVARGDIAAAPTGTYDLAILAVQPPSVEQAARSVAPHMREAGIVAVLQNGLCEARVAEIVGAARVVGAIVSWGASMTAPGEYQQTAKGGFTLGWFAEPTSPGASATLQCVANVLGAIAPVSITDNVVGVRWSKLALNCAISSLGTIAGARLGEVVRHRRYRRLALLIMSEVVDVANALGVRLEKVAGTLDLNWIALTPAERGPASPRRSWSVVGKHALLLAVGAKYRNMRSSMLSAIERGRPPAVDFLNGEVVAWATRYAMTAPVNQLITQTVWAIARGEKTSSFATLDEVCQQAATLAG